jgi:hypothetical protein
VGFVFQVPSLFADGGVGLSQVRRFAFGLGIGAF